jgi:hypothetical protein
MTAIILFLFALEVLFIVAYYFAEYYVKYENRKIILENQYETLYMMIQGYLRDAEHPSSELVRVKLAELKKLSYKNKEKTRFITMEFLQKFYLNKE